MFQSSGKLRGSLDFLRRRLERVAPLFWIVLSLRVASVLLVPHYSGTELGSFWHVTASYLFIPSKAPTGIIGSELAVGWTLSLEMAFYCAASVAMCFGIRAVIPVLSSLLVLLAFVPHMLPANLEAYFREPAKFLEFLAGLCVWLFLRSGRRIPISISWIGACISLTLLFYPLIVVPPLLIATVLVASFIGLEGFFEVHTPMILGLLGDASYSIYLTHYHLLKYVRKTMTHVPFDPTETATILLLVYGSLLGVAVYFLIERPINRFFHVQRLRVPVPGEGVRAEQVPALPQF